MAEVAGLALAVLPLLISALEHRQGISRPLRAFFKFRQELSTALIDLRYVFVAYDQSVRLLLNTRVSGDEMSRMIADHQDQLWMSQNLSSQLKRDLGSAYDESMRLLKRIEATMETIAADLDIGGSDQVSRLEARQAGRLTSIKGLTAWIADYHCSKPSDFRSENPFQSKISATRTSQVYSENRQSDGGYTPARRIQSEIAKSSGQCEENWRRSEPRRTCLADLHTVRGRFADHTSKRCEGSQRSYRTVVPETARSSDGAAA